MSTPEHQHFHTILENYEEDKNHSWFKKTKNILNTGEPEKKYTYN